MPDKKLTDSEIIKAKELIKKLNKAYNDYYDTTKSMPYDIDETLRETAFCFENCLNEINRLQAENERLKNFKSYFDFYYGSDIEILGIDENGDTTSFDEFYNCAIANAESIEHHIAHIIKTAKVEAYKEFAEELKRRIFFVNIHNCNGPQVKCIDLKPEHIDNLLKERTGE